jgi:hypothetical protein
MPECFVLKEGIFVGLVSWTGRQGHPNNDMAAGTCLPGERAIKSLPAAAELRRKAAWDWPWRPVCEM